MLYRTFLYGPRRETATSARPCTRANFRNDGAKNRHACKLNPEDREAVSSTADSTRHNRWQLPKKTPSFAMCSIRRDKVRSAFNALRSCVNPSMPNSALNTNTLPFHLKIVIEHFKLPLLHSALSFVAFVFFFSLRDI